MVRQLQQTGPGHKGSNGGHGEPKRAVLLRVVQAGAVGYVLKDASERSEVARTIRAVAAGGSLGVPSRALPRAVSVGGAA